MKPVMQAENLLQTKNITQTDVESLLPICSALHEPLSTIAEDGLSIRLTAQQTTKRGEVQQAVIETIGRFLEAEKVRGESLSTQVECGAYKDNLQRLIERIQLVPSLPSRFLETLQRAIQTSNMRLAEIEEQTKVNHCLESINSRYNSLSAFAKRKLYPAYRNSKRV
ncbi:hypothetical protein NUACC26_039440 [Scytonema sp. NUACC26]